jgi:hypothetical protein
MHVFGKRWRRLAGRVQAKKDLNRVMFQKDGYISEIHGKGDIQEAK